jgi:dTDP-4-amino-4,6-dideoxygalactose transaminase
LLSGNEFYFCKGRVALYALLRALKVGPSDEIVLPVYTCPEVVEPIFALGARPIFCDIEKETLSLCPHELETALTPKTKAVIIQHTFGVPACLDELIAVARHGEVAILEDCCHVSASTYHGRSVGQFGDGAFYSHNWDKPLSAGGGGVAIVNSTSLLKEVTNTYLGFVTPSLREEGRMIARNALISAKRLVRAGNPGVSEALRPRKHKETTVDDTNFVRGKFHPEYGERIFRSSRYCLQRVLKKRRQRVAARRSCIELYETGFREMGIECFRVPVGSEVALWRYPLWAIDKPGILREAWKRGVRLFDWGAIPLSFLASTRFSGQQRRCFPIAESVAQSVVTLAIRETHNRREIDRNLQFLRDMKGRGLI